VDEVADQKAVTESDYDAFHKKNCGECTCWVVDQPATSVEPEQGHFPCEDGDALYVDCGEVKCKYLEAE
jgi:hypothetical protein